MFAAMNGHTETVKLLIYSNADMNVTTDSGKTAGKYAADAGHSEIVELLEQARSAKAASPGGKTGSGGSSDGDGDAAAAPDSAAGHR